MVQIHKKFADSQVKDLIERYLDKKIERKYIPSAPLRERIQLRISLNLGKV